MMTLLIFLLILSILVFVHELGHFIAARKAGIKVEEFGFGLPFTKPIFSRKKGETLYSIYPMFFGGFVKLFGEDGSGEMTNGQLSMTNNQTNPKSEIRNSKQIQNSKFKIQNNGDAYFEKSIPRRLSVLLAGVTMNLILGIICFSILYFIWGIPTKTGRVTVERLSDNSPAKLAGLKEKDVIARVDNVVISKGGELIEVSKEKAGKEMFLEIVREKGNPCKEKVLGGWSEEVSEVSEGKAGWECRGENLIFFVVPRKNPPEGEGPLGVVITDTEFKRFPWYQMLFLGIREGFKESLGWGKMVFLSLKTMIVSLVLRGRIPQEVAGPIGIYQITGQAAKAGWMAVLQFVGILSVNLAIMNILPLPALDGGRIIFLGYETIFRKKANPKVEMWVNQIGMMILLGLMVLITVNDVLRLIK